MRFQLRFGLVKRRGGNAVSSSGLPAGAGLALLLLATVGSSHAGEPEGAGSCESNLTCARATVAAVEHDFSQGPDLSKWQLLARESNAGPLPAGNQTAPPRVQDEATGIEFILVPGACYETGGPAGAADFVCVDPYYVGAFEVTFDEYDRFAEATGRELPDDEGWGRGERPVVNVSVYDALDFAKWLSRKSGKRHRLPTEVEWEHAARAGSTTAYPWGNDIGHNRANCNGCGSQWDGEQTAPVGSFEPNAWGVYDVIGNVAEWTCSMRDPNPDHSFERCDSIYETRRRAYRNGSWSDEPERLGLAFRDWNAAMRRTDFVGFRLVRECPACRKHEGASHQGKVARKSAK